MNVNDRLTRLEDPLIDLAIVVTEGHLSRLEAHISPDVVVAGRRLQEFYKAVINEREYRVFKHQWAKPFLWMRRALCEAVPSI